MQGSNRVYRYLDSDEDRRELARDIIYVRGAVLQMVASVPEERRYEPRYHGWSLAAMLMHLHVLDNLSLWAIQLALVGLRPRFSLASLNRFNDMTARLFQKRLTETTIRGIRANEKRILDMVQRLPLDKFSREVYDPSSESFITIERLLQVSFLFHWQEHLLTIQRIEGIFYEPPERFDTL